MSTTHSTAARSAPGIHSTSGALTGQGSTVAGTAAHVAKHAASGALAGAGAVIVGTAARVAAAVTHATSGVLTGQGASVSGLAQNGTIVQAQGGGGWLPHDRRKTKQQIYEERVRLGILPKLVVKAAEKIALKAETFEEFKAEKPHYQEMFLRELKKTKWLPDYTRAIQAQLEIIEQEEDDLLLFM